jgi:kynurenine formamidase
MTDESRRPALERIGQAEALAASALVKTGRQFDLGTDLGGSMPKGPASMFAPYHWLSYHTPRTGPNTDHAFEYSMDLIMGSPHQSSHIDGLAHIQGDGKIFGGSSVGDVYGDTGWREHGIETVPPIIGRGILLDVPLALGVDSLTDRDVIDEDVVKSTLEKQGTELRRGDVVLVRTGKIREYLRGEESYYSDQPGVETEAGVWLYDHGMAVLGTDTSGTEPMPYEDASKTVHRALLVDRGVHLLEILNLEDLAAARVYEFMFICSPLKIVGATGSWVRPVALV